MAKMYGTYLCGHEGRANITGSIKDREYKIKKFFEKICPDCYKKKVENNIDESREFSFLMNFSSLEGSEKQESWAETIRMNIFKDIISMKKYSFYNYSDDKKVELTSEDLKNILVFLLNVKSAKTWIENRTTDAAIRYSWKNIVVKK